MWLASFSSFHSSSLLVVVGGWLVGTSVLLVLVHGPGTITVTHRVVQVGGLFLGVEVVSIV
jgi:hypothetical protein